jgi:hypothetical protein
MRTKRGEKNRGKKLRGGENLCGYKAKMLGNIICVHY